ncbi:hypothetical protein BCU36_009520 [Vibrio lentus]|uniref:hypothetical protein n=1 Tax=Vibrio lentus TaxID=136468 RepID=UPI0039A5E31C
MAKQIITLYHAVQKTLTKDQHALENFENISAFRLERRKKYQLFDILLLVISTVISGAEEEG